MAIFYSGNLVMTPTLQLPCFLTSNLFLVHKDFLCLPLVSAISSKNYLSLLALILPEYFSLIKRIQCFS